VMPPSISYARPILTLNSLSFLFWNHNIPSLHMAMPDIKGTCRNPSELSHGSSLLVFAAKSRVSSDWLMSSSKLQACHELCWFIQALLKTRVTRWKVHFLIGLAEGPCATFIRMDGVLLEVQNHKGECCAWSLVATASHILTLKLTASLRLMSRSLSSLFESLLDFLK
jgi:hypothetical protein